MPDPITDNNEQNETVDEQTNVVNGNWYDGLAGDDDGRRETLSKFESPDDFLEDYNSAKNRDWRAEIAGEDEKFKKTLERYADPTAFGNAHREAVQAIRSGQMKQELPEDATEEQIKEYRRENGIPLEAEGYLKELPDGLVIGEEDKPLVEEFVSRLHGKNAPPEFVHEALSWYNDLQEQQQEATQALDAEQSREATDQLRDEWGKDYRTNISLIDGLLKSTFGEEAAGQLLNGRFGDGRGFMNDPGVLKGLAEVARKVNPVGPLIPNDTNQVQALHDEIAQIEGVMAKDRAAYNKDTKMQNRLRELYDMRIKLEEIKS